MAFKRLLSGLILLLFAAVVVFGASDLDSDQDGYSDSVDNCPYSYNKDQADIDGDGLGDVCDKCVNDYGLDGFGCPVQESDSDQDGVVDSKDNCPYAYNPYQEDNDDNGIGDACENKVDSDQDGVADDFDNCPYKYNPSQEDTNNNGMGDSCAQAIKTTLKAVTTTIPGCVLSLCDCKCHLKGASPEETTGRLCGINCIQQYGVSGCDYSKGKCYQVMSAKTTTTTLPVISLANISNISRYMGTIPCSISGVLHGFPYSPNTVELVFCEAYRLPGINGLQGLAQCNRQGRTWRVNVSQLEYAEGLEYGSEVSCNKSYLVQMVYKPADRECEWQGTWTPSRGDFIIVNNSIQNNVDFTFNPIDFHQVELMDIATPPRIPATFAGQGNFDISFYLNAGGVQVTPARIWIDGSYNLEKFNSTEEGPLQNPEMPRQPTILHVNCNSSGCPLTIPYEQLGKSVRFNLSIAACDEYGNKFDGRFIKPYPVDTGDLRIRWIEPVQVLYGVQLIKGKGTAFRANISSSFPYPVETTIRLGLPSGMWGVVQQTGSTVIGLPPGWTYPEIWGPITIPANSSNFQVILPIIAPWQRYLNVSGASTYATRMILGETRGEITGPDVRAMPVPIRDSVNFFVYLDPSDMVSETNEGNNLATSPSYSAATTRGYKFAVFRVLGGVNGSDCPYNISSGPTFDSVRAVFRKEINYLLGVFPIAERKITYTIMPNTDLAYPIFTESRSSYLRRQFRLIRSDYDWAVGVTCGCCGGTCQWDVKSVLIGNETLNIHNLAHEVSHVTSVVGANDCYGCSPGHGVDCSTCHLDEGFWVNDWRAYPREDPIYWWGPSHGIWNSSSSDYVRRCYYMDFSNYAPSCWTRKDPVKREDGTSFGDGYNNLINVLRNPADPEGLLISGVVNKEGAATFDPFIRVHNTTLDLDESESNANYFIILSDSTGNVIKNLGFEVSFYQTADPPQSGLVEVQQMSFAYVIGWDDAIKRIELKDAVGKTIAERTVSPNSPVVQVLYPNGGENVTKNAPLKVRWTASDADNDAMTYGVAISADGGDNWIPVAVDLTGSEYSLSPVELEDGPSYLVRVTATDGVNTGMDVSDAAFTLSGGEPSPEQTGESQGCPLFSIIAVIGAAAGGLVKLMR